MITVTNHKDDLRLESQQVRIKFRDLTDTFDNFQLGWDKFHKIVNQINSSAQTAADPDQITAIQT